MRASRPRCSSRRAGVAGPPALSGRWPTGRLPARRSSTSRSSAASSPRAAGRSAGRTSRSSVARRPRPAGYRTPRRTGSGACRTSSPHSSARVVSASIAPDQHVLGHLGQRAEQLGGLHAVGGREQHDVEHLQGRGVELVEGAVHRHGHGQPAGQGDDVRRRGTCDVGPGRQQGGHLGVAAGAQPGRAGSRGVRRTSGPRYGACDDGRVQPAADDPATVAALAAYRGGALRWLAGGALAGVVAVLGGVAAAAVAEDTGRRVPVVRPGGGRRCSSPRPWPSPSGRRLPAARPALGGGARRDAVAARRAAGRGPRGAVVRARRPRRAGRVRAGSCRDHALWRARPCSGWTAPTSGPCPWAAASGCSPPTGWAPSTVPGSPAAAADRLGRCRVHRRRRRR